MRTLLIKVSLILISLTLALVFTEVALRLMHYGEGFGVNLKSLMEYDPVLGWRHKRSSSSELIAKEFHTTLQFDARGVRGFDPPYSKPPNVLRILVLGDSFVEGYAVQVQDRFTEVLQATLGPGFEVMALGVSGYSTDQELLLLEQEGWKYQPDLVVLAFYYNDVWGNGSPIVSGGIALTAHKPVFVMDAGGNLILTNVPVPYPRPLLHERFKVYNLIRTVVRGSPWLDSLAVRARLAEARPSDHRPMGGVGSPDEFEVYQKTETKKVKREWTITQALLHRMKQEADERGVHFVVFYVPSRVEVSEEEWTKLRIPPDYDPGTVAGRLVAICKAEGAAYVVPSDRFREAAQHDRLYYRFDAHWTPAGNRLAAGILAEYAQSLAGATAKQ